MTIIEIVSDSISVHKMILADKILLERIQIAADVCVKSLQNDGKILLCGNGGSASDAQHIAAELSGRFNYDRPPLYAEALHVNTSYLTAVANDYHFDQVYSRMVLAAGRKDDVFIGISTSGNSANVVNALETAKKIGMKTIAFTGSGGGKLSSSEILLNVPSTNTARIQEIHILIGHIICELIEKTLFPKDEGL
ncbi:MAG: SIS domain-containing protein [Bacteroidales bacterium]|nr:SIS domain-containing protein [Bacteroidales bacterium]